MTRVSPESGQIAVYQPAKSRCSPWLTPLAYFLGQHIVIPVYFGRITLIGQENLPTVGPLILAPTHRSRWDPIVLPLAAGRPVTGRDLRYMVTADEVKGLQGWFIRRLGGFPVNVRCPSISSLRHGIDLLHQGEMLVIFPEGGIFQDDRVHRLKPGLARLAVQAESMQPQHGIRIVPVSFRYSDLRPRWRSRVTVTIGKPIEVVNYLQNVTDSEDLKSEELKKAARHLTEDLTMALVTLSEAPGAPPSVLSEITP